MNDNNILFISFITRITFSLVILSLNIPLIYKIISLIILDFIDCPLFIPNVFKNNNICNYKYYQYIDKTLDILFYYILYFQIFNSNIFSKFEKNLLLFLLILRTIGQFFFFFTNSRKFLFYFPQLFLEFSLSILICNSLNLNNYIKYFILFFIFFIKLYFIEYNYHFIKKS